MEELLEGCRRGETWAQKRLYERHAQAMMGVCLRYVRNKEVARDLMHDGFIKLFTKIHSYSGTGSFHGWMRRIFANTALEYLRQKDVLKFSVDTEEVLELSNNDLSVLEQISAEELFNCLSQLPVGFATVFNMYAVEGYSHAEIAQRLKIQEGTSRSQYARARQMLQKMIKDQFT